MTRTGQPWRSGSDPVVADSAAALPTFRFSAGPGGRQAFLSRQVLTGVGTSCLCGRALWALRHHVRSGSAPKRIIVAGSATQRTDASRLASASAAEQGAGSCAMYTADRDHGGARWHQTWTDLGLQSANVPVQQTGWQYKRQAAGVSSYRSFMRVVLDGPAADLRSVIRAASARRPAGFQCQLSIGKYRTHVAVLPGPTSEGPRSRSVRSVCGCAQRVREPMR